PDVVADVAGRLPACRVVLPGSRRELEAVVPGGELEFARGEREGRRTQPGGRRVGRRDAYAGRNAAVPPDRADISQPRGTDDVGVAADPDRLLYVDLPNQVDRSLILDRATFAQFQAFCPDARGRGLVTHFLNTPTSLSCSNTSRAVIRRRSISARASSMRVPTLTRIGLGVIRSRARCENTAWPCFSTARRRSPSVMMAGSAPVSTMTRPRLERVMARTASMKPSSGPTMGRWEAIISCSTRLSSRRPSEPPGWKRAKCSGRNPRASTRATASASPRARVAVVGDVGAGCTGQASCPTLTSRWQSAARDSVDSALPVIAIRKLPLSLRKGSSLTTSSVSPE